MLQIIQGQMMYWLVSMPLHRSITPQSPGNVHHLNFIAMHFLKQNNTYSFALTDEDGEVISLNGLNLNMTLLFFKKDPIFDQIRNFLRLMVSNKLHA